MTIWLANTTRHEINYEIRVPEMNRLLLIRISSGRQEEVKNLMPDQERSVIDHVRRYGGMSRSELHGKIKGYSGFAYSQDKPFNMDEFNYGWEEVLDAAESRSVVEATKAALATDTNVKSKVNSKSVISTDVELIEENPQDKKRERKMRISIDPNVGQSDKVNLQ